MQGEVGGILFHALAGVDRSGRGCNPRPARRGGFIPILGLRWWGGAKQSLGTTEGDDRGEGEKIFLKGIGNG